MLLLDVSEEADDILCTDGLQRQSVANVAWLAEGRRECCGPAKDSTTQEGWRRRSGGERAECLHRCAVLVTTGLTVLEVPGYAVQTRLVQRAEDKVREKLSYGEVILDGCVTHRPNPISGRSSHEQRFFT
jgi:hypothetical protein